MASFLDKVGVTTMWNTIKQYCGENYTRKKNWNSSIKLKEYSKICKISGYGNVLLNIYFSLSFQSSCHLYLISTGYDCANIILLGANNFTSNANIKVRITQSTQLQPDNFDVEVLNNFAYGDTTSTYINIQATILNTGCATVPYSTFTAGSGNVLKEITSSGTSFVDNFVKKAGDTISGALTFRKDGKEGNYIASNENGGIYICGTDTNGNWKNNKFLLGNDGNVTIGDFNVASGTHKLRVDGNVFLKNGLDISGTNAAIFYQGTKAKHATIRFVDNTTDTFGNGIVIGGGGFTAIGGGESALTMSDGISGGNEFMYICGDDGIDFYTNVNGGKDVAKHIRFDNTGSVIASSFAKINGTSSQFLKADGSVDSNQYLTSHFFKFDGTVVKTITSGTIANAVSIYYHTVNKTFVATDSLLIGPTTKYYGNWSGSANYGTQSNNGVVPIIGKLYVNSSNNTIYMWNGSDLIELGSSKTNGFFNNEDVLGITSACGDFSFDVTPNTNNIEIYVDQTNDYFDITNGIWNIGGTNNIGNFTLPAATASAAGLLTSMSQIIGGQKTFNGGIKTNTIYPTVDGQGGAINIGNYYSGDGITISLLNLITGYSADKWKITQNGDATFNSVTTRTSSDKRNKKNIKDFDALKMIKSLGGIYQFDYKDTSKHSYGLIAQNVKKSELNDIVGLSSDGMLNINYSDPKLVSILLKSVIELNDKIDELQTKLNEKL